jgi:hypothetical protein
MRKQVISKREKKATTTYFACRMPVDVVQKLRDRAREQDRTIGAELSRILRRALEEQEAAK